MLMFINLFIRLDNSYNINNKKLIQYWNGFNFNLEIKELQNFYTNTLLGSFVAKILVPY